MAIYFQPLIESFPISIDSFGNNWFQGSMQRDQGFQYYHWLQTESGEGVVHIDGQQIVLKPGEGIFIAPFVKHAYHPSAQEWYTNFITFNGVMHEQFRELTGIHQYSLNQDDSIFNYSGNLAEMIEAFEDNKISNIDLSTRAYQFFLHLINNTEQRMLDKDPLYLQYVSPAILQIEENYAEDLSVDLLAENFFISSQYLRKLFQRFVGKSPYQHLIDVRIIKAKELLAMSESMSIQEISRRVGFQSPSQFSYMFKKKVGFTPKEFRKYH